MSFELKKDKNLQIFDLYLQAKLPKKSNFWNVSTTNYFYSVDEKNLSRIWRWRHLIISRQGGAGDPCSCSEYK